MGSGEGSFPVSAVCGGVAGAVARTVVAPLDRAKILMQTGRRPVDQLPRLLRTLVREEGAAQLWRGHGTNLVRIVPYSAVQLAVYDQVRLPGFGGRVLAGAFAGAAATAVTHPLDVVRLRLCAEPHWSGPRDVVRGLYRQGGARALYRGFVPSLVSLCPFLGVNFAVYDTLKQVLPAGNSWWRLGAGCASALVAQSVCYPLDTVRRRLQLGGGGSARSAAAAILKTEGPRGFYLGSAANAAKIVPTTAVRFVVYDYLKSRA